MDLVGTFLCRAALFQALEASACRSWHLGTAAVGSHGLTVKVTAPVWFCRGYTGHTGTDTSVDFL